MYASHGFYGETPTEILNAKKDSPRLHNVFQMQNCCHLSVSNFHRKGLTVTFIFLKSVYITFHISKYSAFISIRAAEFLMKFSEFKVVFSEYLLQNFVLQTKK